MNYGDSSDDPVFCALGTGGCFCFFGLLVFPNPAFVVIGAALLAGAGAYIGGRRVKALLGFGEYHPGTEVKVANFVTGGLDACADSLLDYSEYAVDDVANDEWRNSQRWLNTGLDIAEQIRSTSKSRDIKFRSCSLQTFPGWQDDEPESTDQFDFYSHVGRDKDDRPRRQFLDFEPEPYIRKEKYTSFPYTIKGTADLLLPITLEDDED